MNRNEPCDSVAVAIGLITGCLGARVRNDCTGWGRQDIKHLTEPVRNGLARRQLHQQVLQDGDSLILTGRMSLLLNLLSSFSSPSQ